MRQLSRSLGLLVIMAGFTMLAFTSANGIIAFEARTQPFAAKDVIELSEFACVASFVDSKTYPGEKVRHSSDNDWLYQSFVNLEVPRLIPTNDRSAPMFNLSYVDPNTGNCGDIQITLIQPS